MKFDLPAYIRELTKHIDELRVALEGLQAAWLNIPEKLRRDLPEITITLKTHEAEVTPFCDPFPTGGVVSGWTADTEEEDA